MSIVDENVSVIRELFTAMNEKNYEAIVQKISPNFVRHDLAHAITGVKGQEGVSDFVQTLITAFPDIQLEITDIFGGEDRVVVRYIAKGTHNGEFLNIAPTGIESQVNGIHIYKLSERKIVETWQLLDIWGVMSNLGVVDLEL